MLLTDGQVRNESEILTRAEHARGKARVYSFGIGTNVSDVVLRDLARRTSGGVEFIHPGERIDEKVVAQFARAIASRVADARVSFHAEPRRVDEDSSCGPRGRAIAPRNTGEHRCSSRELP